MYFRPVAMQTDDRRIAFVEEANVIGLPVISSEDLPEHATLANCKAKPYSRLIETHVRDYCIPKCRVQRGWYGSAPVHLALLMLDTGDSWPN